MSRKQRVLHFILLLGTVSIFLYFRTEWNEQLLIYSNPKQRFNNITDVRHLSSPGHSEVKVIIILAYMHTCSTFLGSILQQLPGSYYEYESLRSLQYDARNGKPVVYMNGTVIRQPKGKSIDVVIATDAVSKMITCQHRELDISTLSNYYFGLKEPVMRDTANYFRCLKLRLWFARRTYPNRANLVNAQKESQMHMQNQSQTPIQACLPLMTGKCEKATIRVFKFIRMGIETAERLLQQFPDVKIIHLTRDPRAMLDSQVRKNDNNAKHFASFVENTVYMCTRMNYDLDLIRNLKKAHPGSFYSFRYEKFVLSPIKETEKLLHFLGLKMTKSLQSYVKANTILAETNSTEKAAIWRHHISVQHLYVLDQNCDKVYTELGYIKYPSILDIRNLSKPTFLSESPHI